MMSNKKQKILAIKIIKDKAVLTFEERVIKIDLDTYLNGYYYPGKELDEEEFHYLLESEKLISAKRYLMTLLSSRPYTEKMIREKLSLKHHLSKEEIETLLSPYLEAKIIDDENYAYSYTEELIEKGYGRKAILSKLSERGIKEEILEGEQLSSLLKNDSEHLSALVRKEALRKKDLSLAKLKSHLKLFFLKRGFQEECVEEEIESYISKMSKEERNNREKKSEALLDKEALRCYNRIARKEKSAYEKRALLIKALVSRGYPLSQAKEITEREEYQFYD